MLIKTLKAVFLIVVWSILVVSCGEEKDETWPPLAFVEGAPIISDITAEEIEAVTYIEQGIRQVALMPEWLGVNPGCSRGIFFVRYPDQKLPRMCRPTSGCSPNCVDRWHEYPAMNGIPERVPGEGYSGMAGIHLYISRIGDRTEPGVLWALLAHERAHEILPGVWHNPPFDALVEDILMAATAIKLEIDGEE